MEEEIPCVKSEKNEIPSHLAEPKANAPWKNKQENLISENSTAFSSFFDQKPGLSKRDGITFFPLLESLGQEKTPIIGMIFQLPIAASEPYKSTEFHLIWNQGSLFKIGKMYAWRNHEKKTFVFDVLEKIIEKIPLWHLRWTTFCHKFFVDVEE